MNKNEEMKELLVTALDEICVDEAVSDELITKTEAIQKIAEWLETHPEGCGWCLSPMETAELIMTGDSEDE